MNKNRFKNLVDKKINLFAFKCLKRKAESHSKSMNILNEAKDNNMNKRKKYLKENMFHKNDCQLLFKLRSRMLDVKTNFENLYEQDLSCRTCRKPDSIENENHLLKCEMLKIEAETEAVVFNDVFGNIEKQTIAIKAFKAVLRKREVLIKYHADRD